MSSLDSLFEKNRRWAERITERDPQFFEQLAEQQAPEYLWIGCADSRVPANEIVGLRPGELFVHRNVANLIIQSDINALSVVQFAVDVLKIKHIMVVGHYGCGGVKAALEDERHGLVDNWLRPIRRLSQSNAMHLETLDPVTRLDRLCELNVMAQVRNLAETTIVQDAWTRDQPLSLHGWIYSIRDGLLNDLGVSQNTF